MDVGQDMGGPRCCISSTQQRSIRCGCDICLRRSHTNGIARGHKSLPCDFLGSPDSTQFLLGLDGGKFVEQGAGIAQIAAEKKLVEEIEGGWPRNAYLGVRGGDG